MELSKRDVRRRGCQEVAQGGSGKPNSSSVFLAKLKKVAQGGSGGPNSSSAHHQQFWQKPENRGSGVLTHHQMMS